MWNIVPSFNLWGARATVEEEQTFVGESDTSTMATSSDEQKKPGFFKRKKIAATGVMQRVKGTWKSEDAGDETELHVSLVQCGMQPHPFSV